MVLAVLEVTRTEGTVVAAVVVDSSLKMVREVDLVVVPVVVVGVVTVVVVVVVLGVVTILLSVSSDGWFCSRTSMVWFLTFWRVLVRSLIQLTTWLPVTTDPVDP